MDMENNDDVFFDYIDQDGIVKKAEVLTLFSLEGSEKQYAVCSIPAADGNFDITAFIVNNLGHNTVSLDDIEDPKEMQNVTEAVNAILE